MRVTKWQNEHRQLLTPFAIMSIVLALGANKRGSQRGYAYVRRTCARFNGLKFIFQRPKAPRKSSESRPEPDQRDEKFFFVRTAKALPRARRRKARFQTRKAQVQSRKKKAQAPRLHQAAARAHLRRVRLRQTTKTVKEGNKRCSAFLE